jgi:KUP system potassium uptake protein
MALLALAVSSVRARRRLRNALLLVGVFGASLFYGDAVLTPAISVLSAVEGIAVGEPSLAPFAVPIAVAILVALFAIQRYGTGAVGMMFGPICGLWFVAIGIAGAVNIVKAPVILAAINPLHALGFVTGHGVASFVVLGSVLLAVTGAEALYADMGHFGARAIRFAWFGVAAPALVLNYFGQGALLIANPGAVDNPFYRAFPEAMLYPMVVLATIATVIASQATISGAYSMTRQAIQLGYLPRMAIRHTSARMLGQIYVPAVNWLLLVAVVVAVVGFGSSSRLASAYGVAVMGTMLVTTCLTFFVVRFDWRYPLAIAVGATAFFFAVDAAFFAAAVHKIAEGGWFPLVIASVVYFVMTTWRRGRDRLRQRLREGSPPLVGFLAALLSEPLTRVDGTAIFLTATPEATPNALLHSLKHYKVLHAQNAFFTVEFAEVPWIDERERVTCEKIAKDCWRVYARYGFLERPDVPCALDACAVHGLDTDPMQVTYFLSREKIVPGADERRIDRWRDRLFGAMARNARSVSDYFNLPMNRVVELGTRIEL